MRIDVFDYIILFLLFLIGGWDPVLIICLVLVRWIFS